MRKAFVSLYCQKDADKGEIIMKKTIAFALALVLALSLCTAAFAAKPTAAVLSRYKNQHLCRGSRLHFEYKVNSKSYPAVKTRYCHYTTLSYRAVVKSVNSYNGRACSPEQQCFFSGKLNTDYRYFNWTVYFNARRGKYYNHYCTYYRPNKDTSIWRKVKEKKTAFYVY